MLNTTQVLPAISFSTFAEFCAEDDERKQSALVGKRKYQRGGGGISLILRFRQIVGTTPHQGRDMATVENDLEALIAISTKAREKERLALLTDAFIGQCRNYDYQFHSAQETKVSLGRLTIKVFPDFAVVTRAGDEIAVRLWLSKKDISDNERNALVFLLSEAKKPAQWPANWKFGVWELERDRINSEITLDAKKMMLFEEKAEKFAEMWDGLPEKHTSALRSVPAEQGTFDGNEGNQLGLE